MIRIGETIRTSYGTGPFRIEAIDGPCACPEYLRWLENDNTPSEPHYHLTCARLEDKSPAWLNGYRPDGTNVWRNEDRLIFDGPEPNVTPDLFAVS